MTTYNWLGYFSILDPLFGWFYILSIVVLIYWYYLKLDMIIAVQFT